MAEQKKKSISTLAKLGIGCGGLIFLFFIILTVIIVNSIAKSGTTGTKVGSSQSSPKATPTTSSVPASTEPNLGDEAYLRLPNDNDPSQNILLATDEKYFDEVTTTLLAKDWAGILSLSMDNKAFGVSVGTKVLVIDIKAGKRKVRILKGTQPVDDDKVGLTGWVASEWVVSK